MSWSSICTVRSEGSVDCAARQRMTAPSTAATMMVASDSASSIPAPVGSQASSSRSLICLREQVGVFGDVVTDRGSRLPRELFDVVGGSVVASGAVQ